MKIKIGTEKKTKKYIKSCSILLKERFRTKWKGKCTKIGDFLFNYFNCLRLGVFGFYQHFKDTGFCDIKSWTIPLLLKFAKLAIFGIT